MKISWNDFTPRKVLVIAKAIDSSVALSFERQSYVNKLLISESDFLKSPDLCKEFAYLCFFDPRFEYGEFYVQDLVNAFKYTDATFTSKVFACADSAEWLSRCHEFTSNLYDKALTLFSLDHFSPRELIGFPSQMPLAGGYCVDTFEVELADRKLPQN